MTARAGNKILGGSDSFASATEGPRRTKQSGTVMAVNGVTTYYKMTARKQSDGTEVVWTVSGTADTSGTFAGVTIQVGSAQILAKWAV